MYFRGIPLSGEWRADTGELTGVENRGLVGIINKKYLGVKKNHQALLINWVGADEIMKDNLMVYILDD